MEGELSPFEDETLYKILRKSFQVEYPTYAELQDENMVTRVNLIFHHSYDATIFTDILRADWRDLKDLFKQICHRRGRAGAAFNFRFDTSETRLAFNSGILNENELSSALDQIAHLTGIVGQMLRPETMDKSVDRVETFFDRNSDRWQKFEGTSSDGERYAFDESSFRWVPV
ncbi:hypothetical protein J2P12_08665 [Candidatus Bathyarchaeota archaeon]|nr:hypothetical protein [Candidatus Bathyarchaeota archaeon]